MFGQDFKAEHGMTVKQAIYANLIIPEKQFERKGTRKYTIGYRPFSCNSYFFTNASDAVKKEKQLRAEAAARKAAAMTPKDTAIEATWAAMTSEERRKARQDPQVWTEDAGVLSVAVLGRFAAAHGIVIPA